MKTRTISKKVKIENLTEKVKELFKTVDEKNLHLIYQNIYDSMEHSGLIPNLKELDFSELKSKVGMR